MKTIKQYTSALVIAMLALLTANAASASCYTGAVKISDVYHFPVTGGSPTGGYAYIYAVPDHTYGYNSTVYYFLTYNQAAISSLATYRANNSTVFLTGNGTCGTTGFNYGGEVTIVDGY